AKRHKLNVKNFTLKDLDIASGKGRSRQVSQPPAQSTSPLIPSSKATQAKIAAQPPATLDAPQTRSNKSKERAPVEPLDGPDARDLRSQERPSPTARPGLK